MTAPFSGWPDYITLAIAFHGRIWAKTAVVNATTKLAKIVNRRNWASIGQDTPLYSASEYYIRPAVETYNRYYVTVFRSDGCGICLTFQSPGAVRVFVLTHLQCVADKPRATFRAKE